MSRPRLLDLFCGAGGAALGYHRAGFDVIGVDINPQPRYPFKFEQADALTFPLSGFDAVHASPPCHDHTVLISRTGPNGTANLLPRIRDVLSAQSMPFVIENVPGSPMRPDVVLCGEMFGLRTYRHRWFELSGFDVVVPPHPEHRTLTATTRRRERWDQGWHVSITGDVGVYVGPQAMGIDWMTGNELCQAIPPAYTEYVGRWLMTAINGGGRVVQSQSVPDHRRDVAVLGGTPGP